MEEWHTGTEFVMKFEKKYVMKHYKLCYKFLTSLHFRKTRYKVKRQFLVLYQVSRYVLFNYFKLQNVFSFNDHLSLCKRTVIIKIIVLKC
jgi:hypothetical protein